MSYLLKKRIALAAFVLASTGCSAESPPDELVVRVTAQGTCESAGESFECTRASEKLHPRCPDGKCTVRIELDPGTTEAQMTVAFTSLTKGKFERIRYHQSSVQ
jgi:hypothetical protein